ncbi:NAD(P)-dependent oxidoreductase [Halobacterium bonnevillei]|uniref:D-3-phosphoglycerate dehydrogenase n=1 Tax=Halobacterium bonnevillei TaxID=2692200 RepID=A0A6B0SMA7_9EURY|nr:NAD(P)-dependent oxidoreductase [Halobacterium bonnevillei]MXR20040.1 D-3-phosphoglycerate dehydrogenase [Halobacterium bonnevillei]
MTHIAIDQDITPTERVLDSLPDAWEASVGIGSTEETAISDLAGVDVALVTSRVPLSERVIDASDLGLVGKLGTGLDSVDVAAARARDIEVTYTPGMNALSVAEHTLTLLLATARRLTEARGLIETDRWRDEMTLGTRVSGSTVGIVGFGNVGKRVGSLLGGFDVDVLVNDPYTAEIDAELVGGRNVPLGELLADSDFVCVTAELTPETRGLIGDPEFERMDQSTILVNTARGPVVDETALRSALEHDDIAGAGLDVHHSEPLGSDSAFLDMDSVVLTPHIASMTLQSRRELIDRLVENVTTLWRGDPLPDRYLAPVATE